MAVTSTTPANSTPAEGEIVKDGEMPRNLDAARPVVDRIKDVQVAQDAEGSPLSGSDAVVDNSPETAERMAAERHEAEKAERAEHKREAKAEHKTEAKREAKHEAKSERGSR